MYNVYLQFWYLLIYNPLVELNFIIKLIKFSRLNKMFAWNLLYLPDEPLRL